MTKTKLQNIISSGENEQVEFKEAGVIERYGTGIKRIFNICKDYGIINPKFENLDYGFKVTLFKEKLTSIKDFTKDDRKKQILSILKKNPQITTQKLAELLNITRRTIQKRNC